MAADSDYKEHKDGKFTIECSRCGSEAPTIDLHEGLPEHLCKFCYETELGTILKYRDQYPGQTTLTRALCKAFNMLYWRKP